MMKPVSRMLLLILRSCPGTLQLFKQLPEKEVTGGNINGDNSKKNVLSILPRLLSNACRGVGGPGNQGQAGHGQCHVRRLYLY